MQAIVHIIVYILGMIGLNFDISPRIKKGVIMTGVVFVLYYYHTDNKNKHEIHKL